MAGARRPHRAGGVGLIGGLLARLRRRTGDAPEDGPAPVPAPAPAPRQDAAADVLAQGNAALARGDLAEAVGCYSAAARTRPSDPLPRLNLGFALLESGDAQAAVEALQQAIALRRSEDGFLHEALFVRGRAQQALGRIDEAVGSFRAALEANPAFEEPLAEAVEMLLAAGRSTEALQLAQSAIHAMPTATPWMLAARALHALKRPADALEQLSALLERHPNHPGALESSGNLLLECDRTEEALATFQRQLAVHGPEPQTLANLAVALLALERPQEALQVTEEGARVHVGHAELRLNHALAHLSVGDWLAGWEGFEWRWHAWTGRAAPWERWPRWRGEDLAGRSIMLVCEQGLGDSIQSLRYVPLVAARAREVLLVLQPPLVPIARGLAPNCRVLPLGGSVPGADFQCPLMGLPNVFRSTPNTVPATVPYLPIDAARVERWRTLLPARREPRIGLVWSGGPKPRHRSVPLALLRPLAHLPYRFVSLQPEIRESDRDVLAGWTGMFDAGPLLHDFADTAALIQCLDLVITVDTSVAHLAGALGRPVWVLLRFAPDWRWMLDRADSPWYPTMRLYRQAEIGEWGPLVAQVQRDLQCFLPPRQ